MRRLVGYMKPYRLLVAVSLFFLLVQSLFQVLGPLLTRTAVDRYLQPNPGSIPACDATVAATSQCGLTPSAVDLLVGSRNNNRVLRYNGTSGAFILTFQTGIGLFGPGGVGVGPDGNAYVSSAGGGSSVKRFNRTTGAFIDTFVALGSVSSPVGLVFGPDGRLYVLAARILGPRPRTITHHRRDQSTS